MRIPFLKKEGYEADDIIATLVTQALADGSGIDEVLILHRATATRSSWSTDRSTVLYPMRGVSDLARMTPAYVEDRYGVPPARYPELAALVGETSDNLPGVPGVGQGYAAKWLNQYDGLDNVITHADEITGKKGEALREHLADVIRNRRLNALVTDLELEAAPADLDWPSWDRAGGAHALRRARVPGAPHPAARGAPHRGGGGDRRLRLRRLDAGARHRRAGRLAGRPRVAAATGSASTRSATGRPAPATCSRWRSRPRTAPPTSPPTSSTSPTRRRWPPGSRTPPSPRCSTTPRGRCSPSPRAGCRWPAWSATPRCRRTSPAPTSAPTTWPT